MKVEVVRKLVCCHLWSMNRAKNWHVKVLPFYAEDGHWYTQIENRLSSVAAERAEKKKRTKGKFGFFAQAADGNSISDHRPNT